MQASPATTDSPPRRQLRLRHLFVALVGVASVLAVGTQIEGLGWLLAMALAAIWCGVAIGWYGGNWAYCVAACFGSLLLFCVFPAFPNAREAARRMQCTNNVKQIGLALHQYHDIHGTLPPAYVVDGEGRPLYSWRVLLLPYLGEQPLYAQFHLDEPWDSPHNLTLAKQMPRVFACPSHPRTPGRTVTPYVAIVDEDSLWPGETALTLQDITDRSWNTLAVVEWPESDIVWTEPRDLTRNTLPKWWHPDAKTLAGKHRHPGGVNVAMASGNVHFIEPSTLSGARLRALLTRAGREPDMAYEDSHPSGSEH